MEINVNENPLEMSKKVFNLFPCCELDIPFVISLLHRISLQSQCRQMQLVTQK